MFGSTDNHTTTVDVILFVRSMGLLGGGGGGCGEMGKGWRGYIEEGGKGLWEGYNGEGRAGERECAYKRRMLGSTGLPNYSRLLSSGP